MCAIGSGAGGRPCLLRLSAIFGPGGLASGQAGSEGFRGAFSGSRSAAPGSDAIGRGEWRLLALIADSRGSLLGAQMGASERSWFLAVLFFGYALARRFRSRL